MGAKNPSDGGFFFQWGDTNGYSKEQVGIDEGNKRFTMADYKWCNGEKFTKYTTKDATLDLEDDAAHVHMGGSWHIPTPTQTFELIDNTIATWTTFDGVIGYSFTSKKDSSKSIFIPAVGSTYDGSVVGSGKNGGVWASMLGKLIADNGQDLYFNLEFVYQYGDYFRYGGFPVRGVIE